VLAGTGAETAGIALAERLRNELPGLKLLINLGGGNFKTQFKRADKSGADYALVLGDEEIKRGVAAIKPLRAESAQEECAIDGLSERIGALLGLKPRIAE
jgi:histidyl-tRNA synthetase